MSVSDILSIVSLGFSAIAIFLSIRSASQDKKVTLFDKRQRFIDDVDFYVNNLLPSWEFDLSKVQLFSQYSHSHVEALFNQDVLSFYKQLEQSSNRINMLWGDYKHAQEHGECHGKDESEIEDEIEALYIVEQSKYKKLKQDTLIKKIKL